MFDRTVVRLPALRAASIALLTLLAPLAGAQQSAPARPHERVATRQAQGQAPSIDQFLKIRAPNQVRQAPNGAIYCRDWPDGVNQLYTRPAGAFPNTPMHRLTDYKDGLSSYSLSPDGSMIMLTHAVGGNEQFQLSLLDTATGKITPLLDDPRVVHRFNLWTRDGKGFVFAANDANQRDFHLYRFDFATGKREKLLAEEGDWTATDITDDGSRLLVARIISISDARPFELNVATGKLTSLILGEGPAADVAEFYMPGERKVLMSSDREEGRPRLFIRDLASGEAKKPLPALDQWELDAFTTDHDRAVLALTLNKDGYADLSLFELPSFKPVALPPMEKGIVGGVDVRGRTVVWTLANARTPGLAYAWNIGDNAAPRAITTAETQGIELSAFPNQQLVKYTSFDGLEIPAFLILPPNYVKGTKIPFIVEFHGGPEGQHRPGFSAVQQYFVSRGYGIMMPNVRGSTGYGRAFHELDNYKKRWDSVKDGVEAARWLVKNGYADAGKIAAYGGSYGGFMSVATIVEDGASADPVFGASVDIVGIVNFKTFLEQTRDYRRALREVEYGPLSDPEFLSSVSPIHRIDEINVPMFIAHGLNDPRVPVGEAMQLAVGLFRRGLDPEQLYFPDEGHGFAKLENRLVFFPRVAEFLDKTIGK